MNNKIKNNKINKMKNNHNQNQIINKRRIIQRIFQINYN